MAGRRQHHLKFAVGTGSTRRVVALSEMDAGRTAEGRVARIARRNGMSGVLVTEAA